MEFVNEHILSLLILLPVLGAVAVALVPAGRPRAAWITGMAVSFAELVVSLHLPWHFKASASLQFAERCEWIPEWGVTYLVGVDGFSLYLILLTTLFTPIVLLASSRGSTRAARGFVAAFLFLEASIVGSLVAVDLFLFYVFWELMLVPMFLIIGIWGGPGRTRAAVKFLLYTLLGSLLMLVAILWLYLHHGRVTGRYTFDALQLYDTQLPLDTQIWLFAAFALAFAIKVPVFPFHTWLPDAHTEAPTGGSVILAAVLLKLGGYGFLRFAVPLFPQAAVAACPLLMLLGVIGILYGALVSRVQDDLKRLVAFSSVSHLGFVVLGIASKTTAGILGAVFVMLSHGLTTGGLFLVVGMLYERRHTRMLDGYGGLAAVTPHLSCILRVLTLASIGLPGLSGFVGELLVLVGAGLEGGWGRPAVVAAVFGMVFSALYMLHMFGRVMHGPIVHDENRRVPDADRYEIGTMAPVLVLIFVLGLFPNTVLRNLAPAVDRVVQATAGHRYRLEAVDANGMIVAGTPVQRAEPIPTLR